MCQIRQRSPSDQVPPYTANAFCLERLQLLLAGFKGHHGNATKTLRSERPQSIQKLGIVRAEKAYLHDDAAFDTVCLQLSLPFIARRGCLRQIARLSDRIDPFIDMRMAIEA